MKKEYLLICLLAIIFLISGCSFTKQDNIKDQLKFKDEYEELNGNKIGASDNFYSILNIPKQNKIKYATKEEVLKTLDNETGVIYFGFPKCPWCRTIVPILIDASKNTSINNILYFDASNIRDKKSLNDKGEIITEKEGTKEYYQLVERLASVLGPYEGLNDESIKRLYFPTIIFVKNGKIIGSHIGTINSQKDVMTPLTKQEQDELYQLLYLNIAKVTGDVCDINEPGC